MVVTGELLWVRDANGAHWELVVDGGDMFPGVTGEPVPCDDLWASFQPGQRVRLEIFRLTDTETLRERKAG